MIKHVFNIKKNKISNKVVKKLMSSQINVKNKSKSIKRLIKLENIFHKMNVKK